jgi:transcriptional regulator with XRE-family HTH domain
MSTESIELLARAGRALYGDAWQAPLARALGVSLRTLQRWLAGNGEPHTDILRRVHALLTARAHAIMAARADLAEFLN